MSTPESSSSFTPVYVASIVEYYPAEEGSAHILGVFATEKAGVDRLIDHLVDNEMIGDFDEEKERSDESKNESKNESKYLYKQMATTLDQLIVVCNDDDSTSYFQQTWHIQLDKCTYEAK